MFTRGSPSTIDTITVCAHTTTVWVILPQVTTGKQLLQSLLENNCQGPMFIRHTQPLFSWIHLKSRLKKKQIPCLSGVLPPQHIQQLYFHPAPMCKKRSKISLSKHVYKGPAPPTTKNMGKWSGNVVFPLQHIQWLCLQPQQLSLLESNCQAPGLPGVFPKHHIQPLY